MVSCVATCYLEHSTNLHSTGSIYSVSGYPTPAQLLDYFTHSHVSF